MPGPVGEQLTVAHRQLVLRIRNAAAVAVVRRWADVDIDDPRSVSRFAAVGAAIVTSAQRQAAAAGVTFVAGFVAAELSLELEVLAIDVAAIAGHTLEGRQLGEVMTRAAIVARVQRRLGASRPKAYQSAGHLLVRRIRTEVVEANRSAVLAGMTASPRVDHYEVVSAAGRCRICAGLAAGAPRTTNDRPRFHDHCRCTLRPVFAG